MKWLLTLYILVGFSFSQPFNREGESIDSLQAKSDSLIIEERPHVIERSYNHTEQVIAGGVFMASIIFLLTAMNNFNPRHDR
jgi:hypothetical protein